MAKPTLKILAALIVSLSTAGCSSLSGAEDALPAASISSENLSQTIVVPYMEFNIQPGKNVLYCSSFQLAWNELKDNVIKEDIKLLDEPGMVSHLNKGLSTKKDISEDSYTAMAGFVRDGVVDKLNQSLKNKFGKEAPTIDAAGLTKDDIVAYAFMYKNLKFEHEFEVMKRPLTFGSAQVKGFGMTDSSTEKQYRNIAKQVDVIDYNESEGFIVRLKSTSKNDEIILAKVKPGKTLLDTIKAVDDRINNGETTELMADDRLMIPKFNFDIRHSFKELKEKKVLNKGFEDYIISEAIQNIMFSLDEKGAVLKSEAKIIMPKSAPLGRYLVFDKPFLLYIKEKGAAYPYFAVWVDNAELMIKE